MDNPGLNDGFEYNLGDQIIRKCDVFRDLGVQVDASLTFAHHINSIRLNCHRLIGLCFRCFVLREMSPYLNFWKVYIVPIILYCSPLFGLNTVTNINNIEKIQKYFTRRLFHRLHPNVPVPDYRSRLSLFELISLEVLILKTDLITLYKIMHNHYLLNNVSVNFSYHCPTRLITPRVNTSLSRDFYFFSVNQAVEQCCFKPCFQFIV